MFQISKKVLSMSSKFILILTAILSCVMLVVFSPFFLFLSLAEAGNEEEFKKELKSWLGMPKIIYKLI